MRILGLDMGTKRIGVALSDEMGMLAQGKGFIIRKGTGPTLKEIRDIVLTEGVIRIVIGLPLNMDGSEGERAKDARSFALIVEKDTGKEVILWDERLSTKEVEDIMIEADLSRRKRKGLVDKMAAQVILQGYLDFQNASRELAN
ncbi:MAG: Holliday junction resolvase RuvX [Candidatus Omnitrophica bacterium]|nr:Holliday junction resolvase RuvX [Candidatus Omnitrophota bacterium]